MASKSKKRWAKEPLTIPDLVKLRVGSSSATFVTRNLESSRFQKGNAWEETRLAQQVVEALKEDEVDSITFQNYFKQILDGGFEFGPKIGAIQVAIRNQILLARI
jgi:hypothetical protein